MLKSKLFFLSCLVLTTINLFSQQENLTTLTLESFLQLVKQHHPIVKQANLLIKTADANTLSAKGGFDPKVFYNFDNKFYDSKNYYALENGGFKIPTWFGMEIKGGYEQNDGNYLNPENNSPANGLIYSQISLPLLQGLLIDERRSVLKQAKIFETISEFEQLNMINELLYKAGKTYWDWNVAFSNLQVYKNAVDLSQQRLNAVKMSSSLGDRPDIDTVEASIQMQDRQINYQQAQLEYQTKILLLSNFLWLENNIPIELNEKTIPYLNSGIYEKELQLDKHISKMDSLVNNHQIIKVYELKIQQLGIEKIFKQDKLKPTLNIKYNPLFNSENSNIQAHNYKWGVTVAFPILLRKERGDLQMTKIKIENTKYETLNKKNELTNKIKANINEFKNYKNQMAIYSKNVIDYEQLWKAEIKLFEAGESSLFMINSREMSYINSRVKLNEIINKKMKAAFDAEYSSGQLNILY
jgi:outer membrane protein TolC